MAGFLTASNMWFERDGILFCTITHESGLTGTAKFDKEDAKAIMSTGRVLRLMQSYTKLYCVARLGSHGQTLVHRWLMKPPKVMQVDHINGDSLDNRRENLRICTARANAQNKRSRSSVGYRNVYKDRSGKYYVVVQRYGFSTPEDANEWATKARLLLQEDSPESLLAPTAVQT